jgi:hypothetical protein
MDKVVKFSGPILIDASLRRKLKMGANDKNQRIQGPNCILDGLNQVLK